MAEQHEAAPALRLATHEDLAAVEGIVSEAYQPWADALGFRPGPMDEDYAALIASGEVFVTGSAALNGLIVLVEEPGCLFIENVAVRPAGQHRGIGRSLLFFAEREAARRGSAALRLYTHEMMTSNIALYHSLGYVETHREPFAIGSRVHLRKQIRLT
jgi:GNAT superfamily N-acetyltransferase